MREWAKSATFASTNKSLRPKLCVLFHYAVRQVMPSGSGF